MATSEGGFESLSVCQSEITTDGNGRFEHSDQKTYHYSKTYCGGHPEPVIEPAALADRLEPYLDVEGLLDLAETAPPVHRISNPSFSDGMKKKEIRNIAIARDEAFCFYYQENLELLERNGWKLIPLSPLHDKHLPCAGISAILLGGGYPEVYARTLSENKDMLSELQIAQRQGIKFLAECGGFLYLHETLEGIDGDRKSTRLNSSHP